jgi:hypothetical protein
MLFKEIIAIYNENRTKLINTGDKVTYCYRSPLGYKRLMKKSGEYLFKISEKRKRATDMYYSYRNKLNEEWVEVVIILYVTAT